MEHAPTDRSPRRALVLEHDLGVSAGSFGEWAEARGFELEVRPAEGGWAIEDLSPYALLCSLGSHDHAFDDALPWLARELELLGRAHRAGLPVFGICFGSQALARVLGAPTEPAPAREVGWIEAESLRPELLAPGPWLFWHEDRFEVPPGAELLARTPVGPAAYRVGSSMAVQFHPEASAATLERMIEIGGGAVAADLLEGLRAPLAAEPDAVRERAWALYDAFLASARRLEPAGEGREGLRR